jgi:hypothetical protein
MRLSLSKLPLAISLVVCAPFALGGACRHADAPPGTQPVASAPRAPRTPQTPLTASASAEPAASAPPSVIAPRDESTADGDLSASLEIAIRMLENKQYRAFLERFVAPKDRPKLLRDGGIDKLLPEFESDKAARLLEMLRALRGRTPRREGARAVFDGDQRIVWIREGGRWFIEN